MRPGGRVGSHWPRRKLTLRKLQPRQLCSATKAASRGCNQSMHGDADASGQAEYHVNILQPGQGLRELRGLFPRAVAGRSRDPGFAARPAWTRLAGVSPLRCRRCSGQETGADLNTSAGTWSFFGSSASLRVCHLQGRRPFRSLPSAGPGSPHDGHNSKRP